MHFLLLSQRKRHGWVIAQALVWCWLALIPTAGFADQPELVIYTYDSFVAKGGLGPSVFPLFEAKCHCRVRSIPCGDGAQILNRLQLDTERKRSVAHVILGIDQSLWPRAKALTETWGSWLPQGYAQLASEAKIETGFLPFDYGAFALMVDRESLGAGPMARLPKRLGDLLNPEWKKKIILEDPRTSTPGLGFLLFTTEILRNGVWDFWRNFRAQWLTLTPGWDEAYGLFMKKEAPLVWSYTTSQAYHEEHGDPAGKTRRYEALLFDEGQPMQIEGAALVKGLAADPKQLELARSFLAFLISPEVQKKIAQTNWMYPALRTVELPKSFRNLPQPKRWVRAASEGVRQEELLAKWAQVVSGY